MPAATVIPAPLAYIKIVTVRALTQNARGVSFDSHLRLKLVSHRGVLKNKFIYYQLNILRNFKIVKKLVLSLFVETTKV